MLGMVDVSIKALKSPVKIQNKMVLRLEDGAGVMVYKLAILIQRR